MVTEKKLHYMSDGVQEGDVLQSSENKIDFKIGNAMPLLHLPLGTKIHCIEMLPGAGVKIARTAGSSVRLVSVDGDEASLKLPSGEIRLVKSRCLATIV